MIVADEEARFNRRRREVRELEEKRLKEEALLRETARQIPLPNHDTSDEDDEDGLYIFHKNNRPKPFITSSGPLRIPDKDRKRI